MSDIWYILQIASNYEKLINQFIIVPSNWVTYLERSVTTKFLQTPFSDQDVQFYIELAKSRGVPPASWATYPIVRQLGDDAYSYLDAECTLHALTNN